ncbi:Protein kinase membrane associated tyrosine threonine 1 [Biomphalaria glabrata]|uniref:Membrane-associated tyrosine- and threonine-specific cdc2-inhibitory kinase n=1 Tax=Biomphalaria glabrata TaxID=6526 RepID=A0A9W3BJ70_BIOGL|nr:membrane-associated tyrosine- and threonine-specific cdc2-inhibitory kinase-like isoform X2 [Biomphalaria glabrata]KAI8759719.1 membrane-associated tyrosine- and threonine-specific cdc2-inhibitory kinase-like [Biomphalaria glabrata]KAI8783447.1 membrane-associated tyrosine- and threonine-specific cdc2-inhibitory kinase [Biomphalaria glabrata]
MSESAFPSPRPTPRFYPEPQTFSTKKLKPAGTPRDHLPPRPPVKSCPPLSRVFPRRNLASLHAQPVSFKNTDKNLLSPRYNENSNDLYFEQMFEDVSPIGYGSFGEVFKCKSKEDGIYYAVKKSREPFKGQSDRKRKMEEVAKHETLLPHPNCIRFYKAWEERGHLYIQTELCKTSVSEFCGQNQHISEALIWNYMVDLLMALKHLHDHNLVHMDIKPENAFISSDGICKLGDFGLVIDLTKKTEVSDASEGDPKYLAPELLEGKFGKHADIFSLGMFILEMLTDLDLPKGGDGWHNLRGGNLPEDFLTERSNAIKSVIKQMLDPDYEQRPTVDQILAIPQVRNVYKARRKRYVLQTSPLKFLTGAFQTNQLSSTPDNSNSCLMNGFKKDLDSTFSDDDIMDDHGSRNNSDLLNSSDEFLMPNNPPPRRAYTTPSIRRRPASSILNGSPIKRLLFTECPPSTPSTGHPSPLSSEARSSPDGDDRSGTPPPISSIAKMDWDEPKPGIEPKNLLAMFQDASDDDEDN